MSAVEWDVQQAQADRATYSSALHNLHQRMLLGSASTWFNMSDFHYYPVKLRVLMSILTRDWSMAQIDTIPKATAVMKSSW